MMSHLVIPAMLTVFVVIAIVTLLGRCEPEQVIVQIEFPAKKSDRAMPYWFIAARGYEI
jgi:hypothetical protein